MGVLKKIGNGIAGVFKKVQKLFNIQKEEKETKKPTPPVDGGRVPSTGDRKKIKGLINKGYADNENDAKRIMEIFAIMSHNDMMDKFGFSCAEILSVADDYEKISPNNIRKVVEWIRRDEEERTPSYLQDYLQESDKFLLLDAVLDILDNEKLTPEDLQEAFTIEPDNKIRKQIQNDVFDLEGYLENFRR